MRKQSKLFYVTRDLLQRDAPDFTVHRIAALARASITTDLAALTESGRVVFGRPSW